MKILLFISVMLYSSSLAQTVQNRASDFKVIEISYYHDPQSKLIITDKWRDIKTLFFHCNGMIEIQGRTLVSYSEYNPKKFLYPTENRTWVDKRKFYLLNQLVRFDDVSNELEMIMDIDREKGEK